MDTIRPRSVEDLEGEEARYAAALSVADAALRGVAACRNAGHFPSQRSAAFAEVAIGQAAHRLEVQLQDVQTQLRGRREG